MTKKRIVGLVFLGLALIFGFIALSTLKNDGGKNLPAPIVIFAVGLFLLATGSKKQAARKKEKREEAARRQEIEMMHFDGLHVCGLPLAQNTKCRLEYDQEWNLSVSGGGTVFKLAGEKINAIEVHSDVEIQKQYVSSAGGAVAGTLMFGALGGLIGGRVKEKNDITITYYLIISYRGENGPEYLSFETAEQQKAKLFAQRHYGVRANMPTKEIQL